MRLRTILGNVAGTLVRWGGLVALNYHRIGVPGATLFDRGLWSATPDTFDEQLRWLKNNFDVIGPGDVRSVAGSRRGRHVLITFDDGYEDNYSTAFPLLRRHGLSATFFVATDFIDQPHLPWWDEISWMVRTSTHSSLDLPGWLMGAVVVDEPERERAVRQLLRVYKALPTARTAAFLDAVAEATGSGRYTGTAGREHLWMTWDMLREMHAGGMTIGGHTMSHQLLSRMSREQQWEEISGCSRRIEEELGVPMRTFSYPVGGPSAFNADTRECLRRAKVDFAFSYGGERARHMHKAWDDHDVPRLSVELEDSLADFRAAILAPWIATYRPGS